MCDAPVVSLTQYSTTHGLYRHQLLLRYEPLDLYTCMVRAWEGLRGTADAAAHEQNFSWKKSAKVRKCISIYGLPDEGGEPKSNQVGL